VRVTAWRDGQPRSVSVVSGAEIPDGLRSLLVYVEGLLFGALRPDDPKPTD